MKTSTLPATALALSFLFLTSCGLALIGGGLSDDIVDERENFDDRNSGTVVASLKRADFDCFTSNCPNNVGFLAMNENGRTGATGRCTGFLIADNIVATNSHCIPDALKSNYSTPDCEKYMAIRFHPQNGKKEIFRCKQMLNYSDYENDLAGRDFAFFKIDSTGRTPFAIHKGGVRDNQRIEMRRVTPLSYSFGGRSSTLKCRNALNSFMNEAATTPWFSRGVAVGCQIVQGNSGSPMVDSATGKVVGIGQAFWKDKFKIRLSNKLRDKNMSYTSAPDHTLYTSFSCIKDAVTGKRNDELCDKALEVEFGTCVGNVVLDSENEMREKLTDWSKSSKFIYKIKHIEEGNGKSAPKLKYQATPICVKEGQGSSAFLSDEINLKTDLVHTIEYDVFWDVDSDLRLSTEGIEIKYSSAKNASVSLKFDNEKKIWAGEHFYRAGQFIFYTERTSIELPTCSEEMNAGGNIIDDPAKDGEKSVGEKVQTCSKLQAF